MVGAQVEWTISESCTHALFYAIFFPPIDFFLRQSQYGAACNASLSPTQSHAGTRKKSGGIDPKICFIPCFPLCLAVHM